MHLCVPLNKNSREKASYLLFARDASTIPLLYLVTFQLLPRSLLYWMMLSHQFISPWKQRSTTGYPSSAWKSSCQITVWKPVFIEKRQTKGASSTTRVMLTTDTNDRSWELCLIAAPLVVLATPFFWRMQETENDILKTEIPWEAPRFNHQQTQMLSRSKPNSERLTNKQTHANHLAFLRPKIWQHCM